MVTKEEAATLVDACQSILTPLLNEKAKVLGAPESFELVQPAQLATFIEKMDKHDFECFTTLVMLAEMGII